MSDSVYLKQREYLHNMPGGFPSTQSGVEIKILKKLYTPEQAQLFLDLKEDPEPVSAIAARNGMNASELSEKLEEMAQKGLIFRVRDGENKLYQAYQFFVGIVEFQINRMDKELMGLLEEYLPYLGMLNFQLKTKGMRIIPIESSVNTLPSVATYNQARELAREHDTIAVSPCICRQMSELKGKHCERTLETCLAFGDHAQFYIDNGVGQQISNEELMKLLDVAEKEALVVSLTNTEKPSIVCLCCSCCCGILKGMKMLPQPSLIVNTFYTAQIDQENCSFCEVCIERCQIGAIKDKDGEAMEVLPDRCVGCGLCIPTCPEEAISLSPKENVKPPLRDLPEFMMTMKKERGLI